MKALFGLMIISVLLLASCSTAQYSSVAYDDEIYGSSSSSEMNIKVTADNSNYQTPRYAEKRDISSGDYRIIYKETEIDKTREGESSRKAAQEYVVRDTVYYEGDSVVYLEEISEEKPWEDYQESAFDYSFRIRTFHRPNWRSYYYGFYDPYYDPWYYSYQMGPSWDLGWTFNHGFYLNWGWPFSFYSNPFYYNSWGYWGHTNYWYNNSAVNHHNSNNNSRYYGSRTNRGRNAYTNSQLSRSERSMNSSSLKNSGTNNTRTLNNQRRNRTLDNNTTTTKRATSLQSLKGTDKNIYSRTRGNSDRKQVYTKPGESNSRSQAKAVVRYRKPTNYTSPSSRPTGTSREYKTPKINQPRSTTKTVRRIVTSPNRTKNYSTPSRGSRNYSTPTRTQNKQYRTPSRSSVSKSYSTPSKSTRSNNSSTRTMSSPTRSSSSGTRSSGGSSSGSSRTSTGRKR